MAAGGAEARGRRVEEEEQAGGKESEGEGGGRKRGREEKRGGRAGGRRCFNGGGIRRGVGGDNETEEAGAGEGLASRTKVKHKVIHKRKGQGWRETSMRPPTPTSN